MVIRFHIVFSVENVIERDGADDLFRKSSRHVLIPAAGLLRKILPDYYSIFAGKAGSKSDEETEIRVAGLFHVC